MKNNNYKTNMAKKVMGTMVVMSLVLLLAGCGQDGRDMESARDTSPISNGTSTKGETVIGNGETETQGTEDNTGATDADQSRTDAEDAAVSTENQSGGDTTAESRNTQLEVRFGNNGEAFMMTLLDNETAAAIARYVGTSDWRLPIYERDADADYSVLQYYDIPSRYEIPSDNPETVTEAKAGDVFYSDPNRIVLFYHDAEISAEYTKIGTFEATEDFITAVEENPVLEGWGNKIIQISQPNKSRERNGSGQ